MTPCQKIEKYLYLYESGDLSKRKRHHVQEHLDVCESCRKLMQDIQQSSRLVSNACQPDLDEHVQQSIWLSMQNQLERSASSRQKKVDVFEEIIHRITTRPVKIAFSVCAILFIVIHLITGEQSQHQKNVSTDLKQIDLVSAIPVVEDVADPDVQVLTMETDDPSIQVVWFFDENFKL